MKENPNSTRQFTKAQNAWWDQFCGDVGLGLEVWFISTRRPCHARKTV